MPSDLEAQLTPLPSNYKRVRISEDPVLLDRKARVVLDVIHGVAA